MGYAEVRVNGAYDCTVKWPLEFEFVEELGGENRAYTVEVKPFDPGGEFVWGASGGAVLASAPRSGACVCWSGWGNFVSSSCSGCRCGGCSASGCFLSGGTSFDFSGGSCGCSEDHSEEDEPSGGGGEPNTNFGPGVSVEADTSAIVFEDEYSNDYDDTVPRRSTWTCVTVEFAAGITDASCSVELAGGTSSVVMHENSQNGSVCTSRRYNLKKNRTVTKTFYLEGARPSGGTGDVRIQAEISGAGSSSDSASLTVYKVEVEPQTYVFVEDLVHRHELGVGERVTLRVMPDSNYTVVPSLGSMTEDGVHVAPFTESSYSLDFMVSGTSFSTPLSTFVPKKCIVRGVSEFVGYYIASNQAGAVSMKLDLALTPANVSFSEIETQEVPSMDSIHSGYFDNALWQPYWFHSSKAGAGEWIPGGFHPNDDVAFELSCPQPWSSGVLIWYIPLAWRPQGDATATGTVFDNITQEFSITSDGVFVLKKFNHAIRRVRNETPQLFRNP